MPESTETIDAGAGAGTNEQQQTTQDRQGGGDADALTQQLTSERSANQVIKEFAKARGLTVTQLVEQFKTAEDAQKTELQKAMDRAAELERKYGETVTELQRERAEKAIRDAAASAGARADRLAGIYRLVRDDVQYDDSGKPTNVAALIEQAQNDAPEFFQRVAGSGDGGKGADTDTGSNPHAAVNRILRQSAGYPG